MQIGQVESSPHLPTLDALDAEFRWDEKQYAPTHRGVARSTVDATTKPSLDAIIKRPSLGRRASRGLARFLVVFCLGVGTTLAWQLYGDAARAMIANSSLQLGWLAPKTTRVVRTVPEVATPAAAASPDLQQITVGLASVHQSIDRRTTGGQAGNFSQALGDSAAASHSPNTQTGSSHAAAVTFD